MSKAEILEELPRLTPAERYEILVRLTELDGDLWLDHDDPVSEDDKALIQARMDAHDKNPETAIPWEDFKSRVSKDWLMTLTLVVRPEVDAGPARSRGMVRRTRARTQSEIPQRRA